MQRYRKHHHSHTMTHDEKPHGRDKHFCERKVREDAKREIRELKEEADNAADIDNEMFMADLRDEGWYCAHFGPCKACLAQKADPGHPFGAGVAPRRKGA